MKYFIKIIFPVFLTSIIFFSCGKKFLEVEPKGKLIAEKTHDYLLILNNQNWINTGLEAYMGDDVCVIDKYEGVGSTKVEQIRAFDYEHDLNPDPSVRPSYSGSSSTWPNLYNLNKVINEVMDSKGGTETEKKAVLAEARVFRAWEHLMLINRYARQYNPTTASSEPGFAIITTADVTTNFNKKATIQEMYDFIIKELKESIPDLSPVILHQLRISKPASEAILAKTYWLMGKYEDALPLLDNAFASLSNSKVLIQLNNYNTTTLTGGLQAISAGKPKVLAYPIGDPECIFAKILTVSNHGSTKSELLLTPEVTALYQPQDLRFSVFSSNRPSSASTTILPTGIRQKLGFTYSTFGAVSLPDMYLMRAECRARTNNLAGAISDLETLRKNRMPVQYAPVTNGLPKNDLIRYVIDERQREFAALGWRWTDMRRLADDPLFKGTFSLKHKRYNTNGEVLDTYSISTDSMYFKIPSYFFIANPGLEK